MFVQLILSTILITLSSIFLTLSHPLSMGLVILAMTLFVAVGLGTLASNFWLSYTLVLVLLGGLLVIFIYVSLLAPNELFSKKNNLKSLTLSSILLILVLSYSNLFTWTTKEETTISISSLNNEGLIWLNSFYSLSLGGMTVFLVLYLLLTLIVVVTITKSDYSSLRAQ